MKEKSNRQTYEKAELHVILLPFSDVIACSGWLERSGSNSDDGGWTR